MPEAAHSDSPTSIKGQRKPEFSDGRKLALPSTVLGIAEDASAQRIFCACMDGGVYQVDLASGERSELYRHDNFATGVHWLEDRQVLLSSGYDGQVKWFDLRRKSEIRYVKAHDFWSWQSAVSRDKKMIASVTGRYQCGGHRYEPAPEVEPSVKVFETLTGDLMLSLPHVPPVESVAFSNDCKCIAAGNLMGEVRIWEVATGALRASWTTPSFTGWGIIKGHYFTGGVFALAFSPDDSKIYLSGMGSTRDPAAGNGKQLWEAFAWKEPEPKLIATNADKTGEGLMETLCFHPSNAFFVMAGRLFNGTWNSAVYDAENHDELHTLKTNCRVTSSAWSQDGKQLFLAGGNGQPRNKEAEGDFGVVRVYEVS
ncbi:MAG: WD40 repeat protein [Verrucomicrobiales bacterium]|jgi:WD40 repeat protein